MNVVCLDMEGVVVPEIWIAFAEATGIPEFKRTTRDEPDSPPLSPSKARRSFSTRSAKRPRSSSCPTPSPSSPVR